MSKIYDIKSIDLGDYIFFLSQSFYSLKDKLKEYNFNKILIISDENVNIIYYEELKNILSSYEVYSFSFPSSDKSKNLKTITKAYDLLLKYNFNREDLIIALGGGVTGDIAGFISSTYMRGISFINCPTSMISLIDSSIGGKTGVNYKNYKNIIGSFYNPLFVYANISCLKTLSKDEFTFGLSEVIKYALCFDKEFFYFLYNNVNEILNLNPKVIEYIITKCILFKSKVINEDPFDKGKRMILNFGHTVGHALEKESLYEYTHGQAVSIGIMSASIISKNMKYITYREVDIIENILKRFNLPIKFKDNIDINNILSNIKKDKKNSNNGLKYIILKGVGDASIITIKDKSIIKDALLMQKEI